MSSKAAPYGNPETRERILDVALRLAAEKGPAMRLVDVARGADVSHQALYLHFGGRDGLLLALMPHMVERFDLKRMYAEVTASPDGRAAMHAMVRFLASLNARLDSIGWVLEEAQHLDASFGEEYRRRVSGLREVIERDVISRLHAEGSLRDVWTVPDATDLMLSLTALGTWRELTRELGWSASDYLENVVRLLEAGLLV